MLKIHFKLVPLTILLTALTLTSISLANEEEDKQRSLDELELVKTQMSPFRKKMEDVFAKNETLKEKFAQYSKKISTILNNFRISPEEQQALVKKVNSQFNADRETLLKLMLINRDDLSRNLQIKFDKLSKKYNRSYIWNVDDNLAVFWKSSEKNSPPEVVPSPTIITLEKPFTDRDTSAIGSVVDVNLEEGTFKSEAESHIYFDKTTTNGIGHFFKKVNNHNRVKSLGSISNSKIYLSAAGLLGAGGASAKTRIKIFKEDRENCSKTQEHGNIWVVVAWATILDISEQFNFSCSSRMNEANGTELNTTITTTTKSFGVLGGMGIARVRNDLRKIEIKQFTSEQ